jgi:hypothetical protein
MTQRFTTDGSDELEQRLGTWCAEFANDVRAAIPERHLEAIVLGGGYGRGEGGVWRTAAGDEPYNDLEFYIFVPEPLLLRERQYRRRIQELTHAWSEKCGLEFEAKILSFQKIERSVVTMFYHDLVVGHRWIWGHLQDFVDCEHQRAAHRIPLHEATRLLMNRCSGLLFSSALLQKERIGNEDADFVRRNIAKAQLALGDAVLCAFGRYHSSCRERHRRLEKLDPPTTALWLDEMTRLHTTGVEFKLHPFKSTERREDLQREHSEITRLAGSIFLWLEEKRLGLPFETHRDYAFDTTPKHPDRRALRNGLINLKTFGPAVLSTRYPRERLLEALALLLWTPEALRDRTTLSKLQTNLQTPETSLEGLVAAYRTLWSRFN